MIGVAPGPVADRRGLLAWSRESVTTMPGSETMQRAIDLDVDTDQLATVVAGALPVLDPRQRRAGMAVHRLLSAGVAATPEAVASLAGMSITEAGDVMAGLPTAVRRGTAVAGFLGLQEGPAAHRLRFAGAECGAWCAWDTLFVPELVGRFARAESRCPVTGVEIVVEVDPRTGVVSADPHDTLLTFLAQPRPYAGEIVDQFCRWMHFVGGPAAADRWAATAERPDVIVLTLSAGVEIGRLTNRMVLGLQD